MKRIFVCLLLLTGCAVPARVPKDKAARISPASIPVVPHPPRVMIVYVPQMDETAASWAKWFVKYPDLRMVIAMSPRFLRMAKETPLRAPFHALQKSGRLEIALQIPNAPLLPLLVDSSSAKDALPPGSELPVPAYAYPEDVIQLIALSKSDFFQQWKFLPHGLVLSHGAASPKLLSLLERLGFAWIVGALEAPPFDGPYQSGSLMVWDGTPSGTSAGTDVLVWDEREIKERPLETWVQKTRAMKGTFLLPSDTGIQVKPLDSGIVQWKPRTWTETNWSLWIGQAAKNSAWNALRKTREALEQYKNSGEASVARLDAAFSEIYSAQNSNYFASFGNTAQSPALVEERQHEFFATLGSAYRLIGQAPPDDLFQAATPGTLPAVHLSSTTTFAETLADGREHIQIQDAAGDAMGAPGAPDLQTLDVWASSESTHWVVTLARATSAFVDIYVDLNGQPNAGTPTLLPGRGLVISPVDAWEYAIAFAGPVATLYRTQGMGGTYGIVQTFPVVAQGSSLQVTIPTTILHGSPKRWGYQVLVMSGTAAKSGISDFIDPLEISQKDLWQDISTGKRSDLPFIRIRSK